LDINKVVEKIVRPAGSGLRLYLVAFSLGAHFGLLYLHDYLGVFDKALFLLSGEAIVVNNQTTFKLISKMQILSSKPSKMHVASYSVKVISIMNRYGKR
jgi:alpha-beta hydrolase superfamily lysophospholipase